MEISLREKVTAIAKPARPQGLYWMTSGIRVQINTAHVIMAESVNGTTVLYLTGIVDEIGKAKPIKVSESIDHLYDRPVFTNGPNR